MRVQIDGSGRSSNLISDYTSDKQNLHLYLMNTKWKGNILPSRLLVERAVSGRFAHGAAIRRCRPSRTVVF